MTYITTVAQQKGGAGKTSTVSYLASALARAGANVLMVDTDQQSNLSFSCRASADAPCILDALEGRCSIQDTIQEVGKRLYISASTPHIATYKPNNAGVMRSLLDGLEGFDYVFIDTSTGLVGVTVACLMASECVVIPCEASIYSLQATGQMSHTINVVKEAGGLVKDIRLVATRCRLRQVVTRSALGFLEEAAKKMGGKLFRTRIRECVAIPEAQMKRADIFDYAPKSAAGSDYRALAREFLEIRDTGKRFRVR